MLLSRSMNFDAAAFSVADNRTHEFAEWDVPALVELLETLRAEDALEGVGFSTADIDQLLSELETDTEDEVDDPGPGTPPKKAVTRTGDLWKLGRHRLLCGDSTKADDVARVVDNDDVSLCLSDPPYSVAYGRSQKQRGGDRDVHRPYEEGKQAGAILNFLSLVPSDVLVMTYPMDRLK